MADIAQSRTTRLSRWTRVRPTQASPKHPPLPLSPAVLGPWLGMVVGLLEVGFVVGSRWITGEISHQTLTTNWHYAWMIPVCDVMVIGSAGLGLGMVARWATGRRTADICRLLLCVLAAYSLVLPVTRLHKFAAIAITLGSGWRLHFWITSYVAGSRRVVLLSFPVLAAVISGTSFFQYTNVSGAGQRALELLPSASPDAPNVLLIVLDTARSDAMSVYNSLRDTTPNLAEFASKGVRFSQARTSAPWTLPAHASLFTGCWPHELSANVGHPLDRSDLTLAEHLSRQGYASAAFVANTHNGNAWYGLDRGFAHYEDLYENTAVNPVEILRSSGIGRKVLMSKSGQRVIKAMLEMPRYRYRKSAEMINRDALAWVDRHKGHPFFVFLNYYDVHDPYTVPTGAPRPFANKRASTPRSVLEAARDDYDDCLRYLDGQLERLFKDLNSRGLMENTLVVVTSDHGEGFGEHDLAGHGISLYRPELHIPLLVVYPKSVPTNMDVQAPVSLRDIPATIAGLLDPYASNPFPGRSLQDYWSKTPRVASDRDPVLSTVDRSAKVSPLLHNAPARLGRMFSLVLNGRVYIRNADTREQLFDLESDPSEVNDLAGLPTTDLAPYRAALGRLVPDLK